MKTIVKNNCFMLGYILKHVPGLIVYTFLLKIYSGFVRAFTSVYVAKYILDSFQLKRSMGEVVAFLVFLVVANIISAVADAYYEEVFYLKRKEILYKKMHTELFEKAKNIELSCYDNPKFYNDFIWSINQSDGKALDVLATTGQFLNRLTRIVSVLGIIMSIHWSGVVVAVVSSVLSMLLQSKISKQEYALSVEQNPLQRKRDYISRILYLADYAKEIRLSNVKHKLIRTFSETNGKIIERIRFYGKKLVGLNLLDEVGANYFIMFGYVLYLIYLVLVKQQLTYGGFMGLYQGATDLSFSFFGFGRNMTQFQKHSLYIEKFRVFLNYETHMNDGEVPIPKDAAEVTIEFKNVTFKYESADQPTLKDVNLVIHPGEKIALVGYNGAGKTTLVKLLMRLYDPTEGSIQLNGIDIRRFSLKEYHEFFSVVFQDFKLFAGTIAENVIMDKVVPEDEPCVLDALNKSDFSEKLKSMEDGVDTILTREFSKKGVNLSGGEAQKIAIARTFPGDSRIVVLDEPSSALDPITEYHVNKSMLKAAEDKTIFYISHRLSTTKMADRIVMLEDGRIIEEGTHEQLMELQGKYAEMFEMQAEKYKIS